MFQSTHPHRVRLVPHGCAVLTICFNPRTHIGCDSTFLTPVQSVHSFNPRTHIGCDFQKLLLPLQQIKFQSTHPHRVRHRRQQRKSREWKFQSTHPHRVRLSLLLLCLLVFFLFQSTHPHRVRPTRAYLSMMLAWFQSTHPHRVRPMPL